MIPGGRKTNKKLWTLILIVWCTLMIIYLSGCSYNAFHDRNIEWGEFTPSWVEPLPPKPKHPREVYFD